MHTCFHGRTTTSVLWNPFLLPIKSSLPYSIGEIHSQSIAEVSQLHLITASEDTTIKLISATKPSVESLLLENGDILQTHISDWLLECTQTQEGHPSMIKCVSYTNSLSSITSLGGNNLDQEAGAIDHESVAVPTCLIFSGGAMDTLKCWRVLPEKSKLSCDILDSTLQLELVCSQQQQNATTTQRIMASTAIAVTPELHICVTGNSEGIIRVIAVIPGTVAQFQENNPSQFTLGAMFQQKCAGRSFLAPPVAGSQALMLTLTECVVNSKPILSLDHLLVIAPNENVEIKDSSVNKRLRLSQAHNVKHFLLAAGTTDGYATILDATQLINELLRLPLFDLYNRSGSALPSLHPIAVVRAHQIGTNCLVLKNGPNKPLEERDYFSVTLVTGGDDQALNVVNIHCKSLDCKEECNDTPTILVEYIQYVYLERAQASAFKCIYCDDEIVMASGYDQRLSIWRLDYMKLYTLPQIYSDRLINDCEHGRREGFSLSLNTPLFVLEPSQKSQVDILNMTVLPPETCDALSFLSCTMLEVADVADISVLPFTSK